MSNSSPLKSKHQSARVVGTLGSVTFQVSSNVQKTIQKLSRTVSINYAEHKTHYKYTKLEFTGINAHTMSFPITLSAFAGVNPRKEVNKLEKMMRKRNAVLFVLGTHVIGKKWVITDISESYDFFDSDGDVISMEVTVSIKEYR